MLLCFHSWRGPFSVPSSSGQYSSKKNLLSGGRSIPSSWSRIENCAALGSPGLIDHSASLRSQLLEPMTAVWREMSTRQVLEGGGGEGEGGGGLGEGDAAPWPGLCTAPVVAMHARSSATGLHTHA